jgi:hypothetical protein
MGLFHPNTAGHPRCLDEDFPIAECAKALMTFALWFLVLLFVSWWKRRANRKSSYQKQKRLNTCTPMKDGTTDNLKKYCKGTKECTVVSVEVFNTLG